MMPNAHDFVVAMPAGRIRGRLIDDLGKDRISNRLKRLRDQGRANRPSGVAAPDGEHVPSPPRGYGRRREQIPRKIKDVFEVIPLSQTRDHVIDHVPHFLPRKADGPTDTRMERRKFAQRNGLNPFVDVHLDENRWFGSHRERTKGVSDKKSRVGPARLAEIFDDDAEPAVALNQKHIPRPESRGNLVRGDG